MNILIRRPGAFPLSLRFPSALLGPILSQVLSRGQSGPLPPLSPAQRRQILRALALSRRRHPRLTLLEVDSSTGEHVEIRW